jgi:hypothetical protein
VRPDLGAKVFWISPDRGQRLAAAASNSKRIDRRLVLAGHRGDRAGKLEHEMIMRNGEQLGFPRLEPICGRSAKALAVIAVAQLL